ncbi:hypothetical protein N7474_006595 [Penicillium riverlandense]|uniref:uncharacterized protein n=1 Tax=Penicillium riverlandense TaxID=1903569 RepID=UPI0025472415|nr:uncharacterized protein N7474_006595 [Penicillium riverlandense]KAJ5814818.1 hypothetical protein N7474_006595 [Penicillium riverlandense]
MASVSSLDKDLRNMRLSRYTPQAAAEIRDWIEDVLREKLPSQDLLEGLKDGVALCKLVNLAVSPGVKYKQSPMPFVQMENISHFLRACQMAPLNLPPHDVFLTVDLYEAKDPAQVLQCLAAFSRRAHALQPGKFPRSVGPQSKRGVISPDATGSSSPGSYPTRTTRATSNVSDANSPISSSKSGSLSSWSKKGDENNTSPAWNIHQYGYLGGASQGNQGIAFGARRQITTPGPAVPSIAEKEKRRREEEERLRQEQADREEAEQQRQRELEAQEAHARAEEQRRWEEETARLREKERREMEEERRRWDEEKRQWELEEQKRATEENDAEQRLEQERQRRRGLSDARLNGQFLSQYQASHSGEPAAAAPEETPEIQRIKELERELQLAKEREQQYQNERQDIQARKAGESQSRSRSKPRPVPAKPSYDLSSLEQERRLLRTEWQHNQDMPSTSEEPDDAEEEQTPLRPPRPLPQPVPSSTVPAPEAPPREPATSPRPLPERPLPDPVAYTANRGRDNRTDRFLASNPAPVAPTPASHRPQDYSTTSEVDAENSRRKAAQENTRAGGWASKSLLEREMERERERQREWEENQKQTSAAAQRGARDPTSGSGPGQSWDVHQYGYLGGDNQNRGGTGLGVGGARRQIIGPRPPP